MSEFQDNVASWALARNITRGSEPRDQMLKLAEEFGELANAIQKKDREAAQDAIGDCAVVLCIIAEQLNMNFDSCLSAAWDQIKDRKGKLINGVFVKEA